MQLITNDMFGTCVIGLLLISYIFLIVLLSLQRRTTNRETFQEQRLGDTAYAMLDERCWLSSAVVANDSLGMVRHPTESRAGVCVVRGKPPGNGKCDHTNTVLDNPAYTGRLGIESVNGRPECVVRVISTISDSDAQAYDDSLELDTVTTSDAYKLLMQKYRQGQQEIAGLQHDVSQSKSETETANNNWRAQIVKDAATMVSSMNTQRDADSQALTNSVNSANADRDNAVRQAAADKNDAVARIAADRDDQVTKANAGYQQTNVPKQNNFLDDTARQCDRMLPDPRKLAEKCVLVTPRTPDTPACIKPTNQWVVLEGNLPSDGSTYVDKKWTVDGPTCQKECQDRSECTHYSYNGENSDCWLKKGIALTGQSRDVISSISMFKYQRRNV